jgi:cytochrome c oxidase subunit 2
MPEVIDVAALPDNVRLDAEEDGALTINSGDLYTFVGQSVVLAMEPQDVIHAFWVPAFRVKQDVIPGRETTVRFTVIEANDGQEYPKRYPIRCAELCGANHGLMISDVVVYENETTFLNDWLIPQMDAKMHPPVDPVIRGQAVLTGDTVKCNTCHVQNNLGWAPAVPLGPSLNGIADRAVGSRSTATGLSGADYLYQAIAEPAVYLVPGFAPLMPPNQITDDCELQAIVAYLCTQSDSGVPACTIDLGKYQAECVAGGAEASSESTSEAMSEATSELISTPVSEATSEATAAPASEATQEATAEPTASS